MQQQQSRVRRERSSDLALACPNDNADRRERYVQGDAGCDEVIGPGRSGYCVCESNVTTSRCVTWLTAPLEAPSSSRRSALLDGQAVSSGVARAEQRAASSTSVAPPSGSRASWNERLGRTVKMAVLSCPDILCVCAHLHPTLRCRRVTCGPMQPFTCRQKCMELGINPTDALELPKPITCPYEREGARTSQASKAGREAGRQAGRSN